MAAIPRFVGDPANAPWSRWVQTQIAQLVRSAERRAAGEQNANKQLNSSIKLLSRQLTSLTDITTDLAAQQLTLQAQQATLAAQQATLLAIATVQSAEFSTGITGFTGFYGGATALPSVTITSPTGRLEVAYGGSLNSGDGYFCYSIVDSNGTVVVNRSTIQASPARRVAVSGGASFAPSGWKTSVITVPVNVPLTVKLELNTGTTSTYFFGGSIVARVAP